MKGEHCDAFLLRECEKSLFACGICSSGLDKGRQFPRALT